MDGKYSLKLKNMKSHNISKWPGPIGFKTFLNKQY